MGFTELGCPMNGFPVSVAGGDSGRPLSTASSALIFGEIFQERDNVRLYAFIQLFYIDDLFTNDAHSKFREKPARK